MMIRQPLGVTAAIVPFNFPGMIAFWYLSYAIATGNTFILKPSERVPLTVRYIYELLEKTELPKGVVNLINGGKAAVDALLDHPKIRAISFVGSTPVAKYVYSRAAASGKRAQCQGGANVPLTMRYVYELLEKTGLPKGVVNLINGGKAAVDALLDHPKIRAISFVGSTPVAKYVYSRAAANGKRAQCQGGAKNHVIVLPDADMPMATQIISDSAFGCAGQRCLAVSVAVTIGDAQKTFRDSIADAASKLKVGNGLDEGVQMGPVITPQSKAARRIAHRPRRKAGREGSPRRPQLEGSEIRIRKLRQADHPR